MNLLDPKSGLTLGQLVRYGYAGFLFAVLAACTEPAITKKTVEALGSFLAAIACVAVGIAIYVLYRELLGEYVLYPLRHILHTAFGRFKQCLQRRKGKTPSEIGCITALLGELGVPLGCRRWLYRTIQVARLLDPKDALKFGLFHAEVHVLYITALELVALAAYRAWLGKTAVLLFTASFIMLAICFLIDIKHDRFETSLMRAKRQEVEQHIRSMGFSLPGAIEKAGQPPLPADPEGPGG